MLRIGRFFLLPILIISIQPCTIIDVLQTNNSTDAIFTGRILSFHQWSAGQPYPAFVWVFRILHGESALRQHYHTRQLQRPLYVIVDNLGTCEDAPLKYYDVKIFGIRINNARFYSSFTPLPVTVANLKAIEGKRNDLINLKPTLASIFLTKRKINGNFLFVSSSTFSKCRHCKSHRVFLFSPLPLLYRD